MKAIQIQQSHVMSEKERKGLLVISPIIIGSAVYGASCAYAVVTHFFGLMF
ncbi:hypothetical protein LZ480_05745 [Solibacillus sp. MA9]|uniref:Uncharacterized protein n=1 Tax=Solibacillus palustris TaxID=2908203 RepID=A0ABS9UAM4_9BACL|nr:hypothetical protein [Solibacillus sp. MA9]MCH7321391.1 hypothetical protein [Solibacillus sp. MA9]